jgi:hypothetical protein
VLVLLLYFNRQGFEREKEIILQEHLIDKG